MTVACILPPIRRPSASKYRNKLKKTHCYKIRHIKEEKLKFRRLGSGFLPPLLPDCLILDHLLLRMPVIWFYIMVVYFIIEPAHEIMVLITYATSEGSGKPVQLSSLARAFAVHTHEVWKLTKDPTKNQTSGPTGWLRVRVWRTILQRMKRTIISSDGSIGPRQANLCLRAFRHDIF